MPQFMYHATKKHLVPILLKEGLIPGKRVGLTRAGDWARREYNRDVVFLSEKPTQFKSEAILRVDVFGIFLVADLPSLVDLGAIYNNDNRSLWWEDDSDAPFYLSSYLEDGSIECEELVIPGPVADAAIKDTHTAATYNVVPPQRLLVL